MKRALVALAAVGILLVGCGPSNENEDCIEELGKDQAQTASRVIEELDAIGDTIEGALDVQKKGGLDAAQERLLRKAQARARAAQQDLEAAFSIGCE